MLISKLQKDAPSAKKMGAATLYGYRLCWHKPSTKDGSGKCDISESAKDHVHGVIYEIAEEDMAALDRAEGGYTRRNFNVEYSENNLQVCVYVANKQNCNLLPHSWYKALVLAGARAANFPEEYIAQLESVGATQDPDQNRHNENMALADAG